MIRATGVRGQQSWKGEVADTVVLAFDDRHRRRMTITATRGLQFLLDLPQAVALRGGDALVLEDGRLIEVVAAPEPLVEVRADDQRQMVRIAWHLGNRHLPTQIVGRGLRIRRDHVIEDMLRGLGAKLVEIDAPFDPEGGAYVQPEPAVGHSHEHEHDHDHDHGHDHKHAHKASHGHGHKHEHAAAREHDHHDHHSHAHDEYCDDPSHDHSHDHGHDHGSPRKGSV